MTLIFILLHIDQTHLKLSQNSAFNLDSHILAKDDVLEKMNHSIYFIPNSFTFEKSNVHPGQPVSLQRILKKFLELHELLGPGRGNCY